MGRLIRVDFSGSIPQPYWIDKDTGQLSFIFDVPWRTPARQVDLIEVPRAENVRTFSDAICRALERREK